MLATFMPGVSDPTMTQTLLNQSAKFLDQLGIDGDRVLFKLAILAHKIGLKQKVVAPQKPYQFDGFSMYLDAYDTLQLTTVGKFEETETATILGFVTPDTVMLDIGANMGYYSVRAGQLAHRGKVFAFEPDPGNFATLTKNLVLNQITNVQPINAALSDKPDTLRLYKHPFNVGDYRLYNDGDFTEFVDVPTLRVDEVVQERIDLIKIDVQGYEYFALKGAEKLLTTYKPVIVSEFWPRGLANSGASATQYLDFIEGLGYRVRQIDDENKQVIDTDFERLRAWSNSGTNRYLNLVFIPA
jgi:FkbM family methyltransferase